MKVSFYLLRPDSDTDTAIFARICYKGSKAKFYIPEKIKPRYWDRKRQRAKSVSSFPQAPEFNDRLEFIGTEIGRVFTKWVNDHKGLYPHPDTLRDVLEQHFNKVQSKEEIESSLLPYFAQLIKRTENGTRVIPGTGKPYSERTIKAYRTSYKTIEGFAKSYSRKVDFETLDQNFYEDYRAYLTKKLKKRVNTVGKEIKTLKTVLNDAAAKGIKVNPAFKSRAFSVISEDANTIYLNESELAEMYSLDLSSVPKLERVRDRFIVAANTGLRFDDVNKVKSSSIKGGMITITQGKTGNPVVIPVHPYVTEILAKYGGELPEISNQKFNEYIREVAKMVPSLHVDTEKVKKGGLKALKTLKKWEMVSSHTARRSFATNQHRKGLSSIIVMAITGHRTEKSFLKYIRYTPEDSAIIMKQFWEKENQLKAVN
jgi:site-specific recombinase XerD